jgi:hypothetical protein
MLYQALIRYRQALLLLITQQVLQRLLNQKEKYKPYEPLLIRIRP